MRTRLTPHGATARVGGRVGLVDALIHHQDMRRPLGLPRQIPAERLLNALPFTVTAPPLRGLWNARGVRLVATDLDWSRGKGPEARGPAEAVLMVLAGAAAWLANLPVRARRSSSSGSGKRATTLASSSRLHRCVIHSLRRVGRRRERAIGHARARADQADLVEDG